MAQSRKLLYNRPLLKLSGEALMGKAGYGIEIPSSLVSPATSPQPSTSAPRSPW